MGNQLAPPEWAPWDQPVIYYDDGSQGWWGHTPTTQATSFQPSLGEYDFFPYFPLYMPCYHCLSCLICSFVIPKFENPKRILLFSLFILFTLNKNPKTQTKFTCSFIFLAI
jgi:hypothetical protein